MGTEPNIATGFVAGNKLPVNICADDPKWMVMFRRYQSPRFDWCLKEVAKKDLSRRNGLEPCSLSIVEVSDNDSSQWARTILRSSFTHGRHRFIVLGGSQLEWMQPLFLEAGALRCCWRIDQIPNAIKLINRFVEIRKHPILTLKQQIQQSMPWASHGNSLTQNLHK